MNALGNWKAYLYNKADVFQVELPFDSITITKELNKIGVARLGVSYFILNDWITRQGFTPDDLLTSGMKWVSITRDNSVMFKGILSEVGMDGSGEDIKLNLTFKNWFAYFQKRFTSESYSGVDAGQIAWGLIETAQSETGGDMGITEGSITATKTRDRTYAEDEIALAITRLSTNEISEGFDFEITDEKIFNVYSRLGSDKPQIVFDESNIKNWRLTYMIGLGLTNQVIVLGDEISETRTSTSDKINKWGLLERKASYVTVIQASTLQAHGDRILASEQDVIRSPELTVLSHNYDINDYNVGDGVTVRLKGIIDSLYRIKTKTISVTQSDEVIRLSFETEQSVLKTIKSIDTRVEELESKASQS